MTPRHGFSGTYHSEAYPIPDTYSMSKRKGLPDNHSAQADETSAPASPATVLVVEDEPDLLNLMEHNLMRSGFRVVTAVSLAVAQESLKFALPDLIILDIMLPDGSGLKFCGDVHEAPRTSKIPIVLVTASLLPSDREEAWAAGASDYLTKPFAISELIDAVKKHLNGSARPTAGRPELSRLIPLPELGSGKV